MKKAQVTAAALGLFIISATAAFAESEAIVSLQTESFTVPDTNGITMLRIESGTFTMGSPEDELGRGPDEPQREVTISKPFYMAETLITQEQYLPIAVPDFDPIYVGAAAYGHSNPELHQGGPWTMHSQYRPDTSKYPMDGVRWEAAVEFCEILTERERLAGRLPEGYVYRLPTEAEWEYACRAGTEGPFNVEGPLDDFALVDGSEDFTVKAGRQPNAWGLYDMHGNKYEWCLDWYGPLSVEPATDPTGPATGTRRVARGGSSNAGHGEDDDDPANKLRFIRSAARNHFIPDFPLPILGLRVVLAPEIEQKFGADFIPRGHSELPHLARTPHEALKHWTAPEGFKVELVAAEPTLVNPINMTIDERGRFWVVESVEYPRMEAGPGEDRIRVMEDTTGDGKIDKDWIFADGLNIPCGIAVGYGGVWVSNAPDILFMQDTTGDGRADTKEVVVTGFGRRDMHELPNSFTWGPDGWLYGLNGVFNPSEIEQDGQVYGFDAAIFRIHPITREFQIFAQGTSNPWGIAFDPDGSMFISACVIDHLWHIAEGGYYIRQAGAYPSHTWSIGSIVNHSHHRRAYCGLVYFDSDAYPESFRDSLYMGNIHGAKLNADVLERRGSTYFARPHETRVLMESNDVWHMPVDQAVGPDGLLYVLDWYDRYNCYQDALRDPKGVDRQHGRLWRLNHENAEIPNGPAENMGELSDGSLIERLHSANIYHRETAQRLLGERMLYGEAEAATRQMLENLVLAADTEHKPRMHALFSMLSSFELDSVFHEELFEHEVDAVRAWAVRAAGNFAGDINATVRNQVLETVNDPSPEVLLQTAIAAPKLMGDAAVKPLVDVLAVAGDDPLIPHIVWEHLHPLFPEKLPVFMAAVADHELGDSAALHQVVRRAGEQLAEVAGEQPSHETGPASELSEEEMKLFATGNMAYQTCMACHGSQGQGMQGVASALDGSKWVNADPEPLVRIVLHGFEGEDPAISAPMPSHRFLSDEELAAILTFIRQSWSNEASPITPEEVTRISEETGDRLEIWSVEELEALLAD